MDVLRMLDAKPPIARAVRFGHPLVDIELRAYRSVADRVDDDLQTLAVGVHRPILKIFCRVNQQSAVGRRVAERLQERRRVRTERAIDETFQSADPQPIIAAPPLLYFFCQPFPLRERRTRVNPRLHADPAAATRRNTSSCAHVPK